MEDLAFSAKSEMNRKSFKLYFYIILKVIIVLVLN